MRNNSRNKYIMKKLILFILFVFVGQLVSGQTPTNAFNVGDFNYKVTNTNTLTVELVSLSKDYINYTNVVVPSTIDYTYAFIKKTYKITSIGSKLLYNGGDIYHLNPFLEKVSIPEGITSIGDSAFYNCTKLSGTLVFPSTLKSIGKYSFYGYTNVFDSTIVKSTTPPTLGEGAFQSLYTFKLYVPYDSYTLYNSSTWKPYCFIYKLPKITSVPIITDDNIKVYPGIVKDAFKITGLEAKAGLNITDMNGRLLFTKSIVNDERIATSSLSKGVYFVNITTSKDTIVRRIIKE